MTASTGTARPAQAQRVARAPVRRWITACAVAEGVAMGTAALLARLGSPGGRSPTVAVALAVGALTGLVEGSLLGVLQWRVLRVRLPSLPALAWIGVTQVVAIVGWVLGSAPSAASGDGGATPPVVAILGLAALLGASMGLLFGAAQWLVLRRHAPGAGRWVVANAAGWTVAMPVIFLGATSPDASTPLLVVGAIGVVSGACAGLALGAVTSRWLVHLVPLTHSSVARVGRRR